MLTLQLFFTPVFCLCVELHIYLASANPLAWFFSCTSTSTWMDRPIFSIILYV